MNVPSTTQARALAWLETFLLRQKPGFADDARMVDQARALSERYTGTGERVIDDDAAASLAYLAYFGPRAIVAVLRAARTLGPEARKDAVVVDVGAGSGASALAWSLLGAKEVILVEKNAAALELAKKLLGAGDGRNFSLKRELITDTSPIKEVTLVSAAFCVGEWKPDAGNDPGSDPDIKGIFGRVAPAARHVVVVDAGDHDRARRLQRLRDQLVKDADVVIVGPCGHRDPCPALLRERDWCHDRADKELPAHLLRFAKNVGRDERTMNLSWLVWGRHAPARTDAVVVIGEPIKEKGRARLPVCGPGGLRFVQALKRDREAFHAVLEMPRGARLPLPPTATGDTWHVDSEAALGDVAAVGDVGAGDDGTEAAG